VRTRCQFGQRYRRNCGFLRQGLRVQVFKRDDLSSMPRDPAGLDRLDRVLVHDSVKVSMEPGPVEARGPGTCCQERLPGYAAASRKRSQHTDVDAAARNDEGFRPPHRTQGFPILIAEFALGDFTTVHRPNVAHVLQEAHAPQQPAERHLELYASRTRPPEAGQARRRLRSVTGGRLTSSPRLKPDAVPTPVADGKPTHVQMADRNTGAAGRQAGIHASERAGDCSGGRDGDGPALLPAAGLPEATEGVVHERVIPEGGKISRRTARSSSRR
jgi:hypothetical protein